MMGQNPGFNTVDAARVIRNGKIVFGPDYDAASQSWLYEIWDRVENRSFVLIILLNCNEDFDSFPVVTVKSGYFGKPRKKGKKS